jgi:methylthioribulose-1-phosphate dehydratase
MAENVDTWKEELVACIRFLHQKGFAPATSSNYSFRIPSAPEIHISASGIDKGSFTTSDLMLVDAHGKAIDDGRKPSAETLLHTMIYRVQPETTCVLHTHTVYNTCLSAIYEPKKKLVLEGFEVLKGLNGIRTHKSSIEVPIFANSQDIAALSAEVESYWKQHPVMKGFLLAGHGLYTWGKSIAEAKRHIEVFEFLFECYYKINQYKIS